ncbi:syntaxin-binding protein 6 isoform X1 [Nycticebus coucang]|nr:syntaxin-binding protein 6 isoform X1 [Nycticebus coucang]
MWLQPSWLLGRLALCPMRPAGVGTRLRGWRSRQTPRKMLSSCRVSGEGAARPGAAALCQRRGTQGPGFAPKLGPGVWTGSGKPRNGAVFSKKKLRMKPFFLHGPCENSLRALLTCPTMSAKSAISKEIFAPLDERMLGAVQVKRRTKKKIPFLATGGQGEYLTYICLSVTNKKPTQASITKVKQFEGSTSFVRRSQWMLEQLRQVNGIDPNRDSAEFDLLFENAFDQWVASTASEKCTFFQILHHTCQRYLTDRKPEFINCQSKIMGGNSILHSAADSVTSAVQKASQALNERGERLGRAEEKTEELKNSAQQFAETAHKLAMKHKC